MALNPIQRAIKARQPKPAEVAPPPQDYSELDPYGETTKQKVATLTAPSEEKQYKALQERFTGLEQKLFGQEMGQAERESDILARKFARIGPTGTEQKAYEVAGKAAGRRLEEGQETIKQEKLAQQEQLQQLLEGRRLQAAERFAGEEFTAGEAEKQRTFDEGQNKLNRELIDKQITLGEKELAVNVAVSLSNLSQVESPEVMQNIIDLLKKAGVDTTYYEGLLAKMQETATQKAEPAPTVDTSKPAGQAPEILPTSPGGVALPGTSGELIDFANLGQAPEIQPGGFVEPPPQSNTSTYKGITVKLPTFKLPKSLLDKLNLQVKTPDNYYF